MSDSSDVARTMALGSKPRSLVLRLLVCVLALANAYGLFLGLTRRAELTALFPRLDSLWPVYLACPVMTLVALAAIWRWRAWGVWLAISTGILVMAIELFACGPAPHVIRVPVAIALLAIAVRSRWKYFY